MQSIEDVFTSGGMDTIAASGDNINYFDPADEDENDSDNSNTQEGAAMFRQRASALSKKSKTPAVRKQLNSKQDGSNVDRDSITSRTRSKSKL